MVQPRAQSFFIGMDGLPGKLNGSTGERNGIRPARAESRGPLTTRSEPEERPGHLVAAPESHIECCDLVDEPLQP